jgi:peptide/nickel transport system permease protein
MIWLVRRVLAAMIQLALLSVVLSALFRATPGDFFTGDLADPQRSKSSIAAARESSGANQSWARQYVEWVRSSLHGEFGRSLAYGTPVSRLVAPRIMGTLQIALPALALAWLFGLAGAVASLRLRPAWAADPGAAAAAMVPDVVTVSLLLWVAVWAGVSVTGRWLPVAGLICAIAPVVFLHASGALRESRELEFVRIAQSRHLPGTVLWGRYILPAAANPLLSLAGLSVASAIGSSFVVEVLTGWPGIGPLFLDAVQARDYPVVQSVLMLLAAVLSLSNLVADLALYRLDPRIRLNGEQR